MSVLLQAQAVPRQQAVFDLLDQRHQLVAAELALGELLERERRVDQIARDEVHRLLLEFGRSQAPEVGAAAESIDELVIAQQLAGSMLEMADLGAAEICDAIGELTNLIGGAVQALLPAPSELSHPSVVAGKDYRLIFPRCSIVNEIHLGFCAEPISLMLFEAHHDKCVQRAPELGCSLTASKLELHEE